MRIIRFALWLFVANLAIACAQTPAAVDTPTFTPVASLTPTAVDSGSQSRADDRFADLPQSETTLGFPQLGFPSAPVSVVVYSGFDCADCARFHKDANAQLAQRARTGEVLLTFVPLYDPQGTTNGQTAARAALCAGEQDAFWQYQDALYRAADESGGAAFTSDQLLNIVTQIGIDREPWDECMLSARPNTTLTNALNSVVNVIGGEARSLLAVFVNNQDVPADVASVDLMISSELVRVNAMIDAALTATEPLSPEATIDPESTEPVVITLQPLQNQPIPPPLMIDLPDGWRQGHDTLLLNDVSGMRSVPFSVFTGPISGGAGSIVLLWGFPNLVAGNPFDQGNIEPDLFSDGLRFLRLAILEQGCNIGTDLNREYSIGGLTAVGTSFSAVTCPELPDTRGWFAGLQQNGVNFIFYIYTDPIDAIDSGREELQTILDSVRFILPTPVPPTPTGN